MHQVDDLIRIFNDCFQERYQTVLCLGEDEPLYLPAAPSLGRRFHSIYFAHGYFSSALHEIAHWLIAGEARRQLEDYGYWYEPDGRNAEQQALFQQVEVKPQALECILARAAHFPFRISLDNLNGEPMDSAAFEAAVMAQVAEYQRVGLSARALQLEQALAAFYANFPAEPQSQIFIELDQVLQ